MFGLKLACPAIRLDRQRKLLHRLIHPPQAEIILERPRVQLGRRIVRRRASLVILLLLVNLTQQRLCQRKPLVNLCRLVQLGDCLVVLVQLMQLNRVNV